MVNAVDQVELNLSPTWTKWSPFRGRYIQIYFCEWKNCILIKISLKFVLKAPIDTNPALDAKPLSEPMLTRLTDAYMRHEGEMS